MISQSQIKWIRSLAVKKFRQQEKLFLAEGEKIVNEMLDSDLEITHVYALKPWVDKKTVAYSKTQFHSISQKELERISTLSTPNNVVAICKIPDYKPDFTKITAHYSLYLDNIQDPGNMGTIIRTADWFGINHVICSPDSVDCYNPKVVQASMGSLCRIRVNYISFESFFSEIPQGFPFIGASLDGSDLNTFNFPPKGTIVIGNESRGISEKVMKNLTNKVYIPRGSKNSKFPESLNASVAAGILMAKISLSVQ